MTIMLGGIAARTFTFRLLKPTRSEQSPTCPPLRLERAVASHALHLPYRPSL